MSRFLARIVGFLSNRTQVGVDRAGNRYFARKEEVDGIMKEKRWVVFKGEEDPTTVPVEWICWLNGQRKKAPTLEEMMELEARRERIRQNVARVRLRTSSSPQTPPGGNLVHWAALFYRTTSVLKKEEVEKRAKEGSTGKRMNTGKIGGTGPDLKSFIRQFPVPSEGDKVEESSGTMGDMRNSQENASEKAQVELESSEPSGTGASFKPGTWRPPT